MTHKVVSQYADTAICRGNTNRQAFIPFHRALNLITRSHRFSQAGNIPVHTMWPHSTPPTNPHTEIIMKESAPPSTLLILLSRSWLPNTWCGDANYGSQWGSTCLWCGCGCA